MRTYVACDVPERDADDIRRVLERLEHDGHFVADVRHERSAGVWRVFAHERRSREVISINRRRETD